MSTSRSRRVSHKSLFIFLGFALLAIIGFGVWRIYLRPAPSAIDIFAVGQSELSYGDTTVSGTLRKDAPSGQSGTYILVLPDGRPILLDVSGLDSLLSKSVVVSGNLSPSVGDSPMTMVVSSVKASSL